jgi:hypothetical protein
LGTEGAVDAEGIAAGGLRGPGGTGAPPVGVAVGGLIGPGGTGAPPVGAGTGLGGSFSGGSFTGAPGEGGGLEDGGVSLTLKKGDELKKEQGFPVNPHEEIS